MYVFSYIIISMRLSELRKLVREVMREAVIDKDGLERAGSSLPQTVEFDPEELAEVNTLVGGFGLSAIAEKFGVSVDSLVKEFKAGIKYEMQSTDDRDVAKNRVLRNMSRDAKHYTNNSLVGETLLKEYTKGQIFGGKIKIGGNPVEVEVELLGADNKKKTFITKIINVDKKWWSKLPKDGILEIPSRIFRTPGGGWFKVKTPKVFESKGCGCGCSGKSKKCSI
jgi:hypothetical protein